MSKHDDKFDSKIPANLESSPKLEFESGVSAAGLWFAVAALFVVLAAGIIVYRIDNSVIRTASNDTVPVGAQSYAIVPALHLSPG